MAKLQEKKFFKVIILIVVFCIPIIYSFFYLKSYWDPYGKLENMDVAIVNLDKGKDGENKGKELVDKLVDKNVLKLSTVTEEEANQGLSNQQYYATITIPENFTENLESAIKETPAENNTLPVNELKETADFQHPGQRSCTPTETESLQATG